MRVDLTDEQILAAMTIADYVRSCDEAFRLYASGELTNLPCVESLIPGSDGDTLRLELAGEWAGRLRGRKIIVEHSDAAAGRLGERSAVLEVQLENGKSFRLDAESVTNHRTGAAAALGARYLAKSTCDVVAIVGTGRIAFSAAQAVDRVISPAVVRATSRSAENRHAFRDRAEPVLNAKLETVASIPDTVSEADVVIVAVPTPEPVLANTMLKHDTHVSVLAGDPRTVQLDSDILLGRPVVVDHFAQSLASGDFVRYSDQVSDVQFVELDSRPATVGDAAIGALERHRGVGCVTYFTGMAIQDLHAASVALSKVGLGT